MELLIIVIIAFLIGKAFGGRKNRQDDDWPDEPVQYEPPKKKKGCFARLISLLFKLFVTFILFVFIVSLLDDDTQPQATSPDIAPPPVVSNTFEETSSPTVAPTAIPTAAPTAEPATREDWVLRAAQEVYRDDLISVTWQEVDNQKDMIVIWCNMPDGFSNSSRRLLFMGDAKNMFKRVSELGNDGLIEYGSCYIVGRTTYLDNYGKEFDGNAMEIRLKEEDLSQIKWENMNSVMLSALASNYGTFGIHPLLRD